MRRIILATLATALTLSASTTHAQIGRIRRAVTAVTQPQAAGPTRPVDVQLTADVVTRYIKAMNARQAEIVRRSRLNTDEGRYYAAVMRRDAAARRQNDYRQHRGPDWAEYQRLESLMMRGDTAAAQAVVRLEASVNARVDVPEPNWEDQRKANAGLDSIAMNGGGFSAGEWMDLGEKFPRVVGSMSWDGAVADSTIEQIAKNWDVTVEEVRTVREHRIELATAMGIPYRTDAEIVEANKPPPGPEESSDPNVRYSACLARELQPFQDEAKRRAAEFEAAKARNDMTPLMEFSGRMLPAQQAAMEKCAPILQGH